MQMSYKALLTRQTSSAKTIALFAASSAEITQWAGVPQKRRIGQGEETAGFQREENAGRIRSLQEFYSNPENMIQNPLLCALRDELGVQVTFHPDAQDDDSPVQFGTLTISFQDYSSTPLVEMFGAVRKRLERRVADLATRTPDALFVTDLKHRAYDDGHAISVDGEGATNADDDSEALEDLADAASNGNGDTASAVLFDESHIADFWHEVAARHEVLKEIDTEATINEFLGFSREALLSYLQPVVLVDGQHRLRGAVRSAEEALDDPGVQSEIETLVENGASPDTIQAQMLLRHSRQLPISLLLNGDPAEQVFQFIVVNQKATPVGRALLGTIVSTTLSNDEMARVAERLKSAGIALEESQAVTYMVRHPDSPFHNLVERGLTGDAKDLLQWNVLASLIGIFRDLSGGKLYGYRNDYADLWRQRGLGESKLTSDHVGHGYDTPFSYWRSFDGPWRAVFVQFWRQIRDRFGNTLDPDKPNYWGRPRESNLFNKISLTILAADFFKFMVDTRAKMDSPEDVASLVDDWLEHVNLGYFDKDWDLSGVKKDSTGIRNQWAEMWSEYRCAGGQLPDKRNFRKPKQA